MLDDQIAIAEKLAFLKAACGDAPDSPGKLTVLKYCLAAEKAHIARNTLLTIIEIEAASAALGDLVRPARCPARPGHVLPSPLISAAAPRHRDMPDRTPQIPQVGRGRER